MDSSGEITELVWSNGKSDDFQDLLLVIAVNLNKFTLINKCMTLHPIFYEIYFIDMLCSRKVSFEQKPISRGIRYNKIMHTSIYFSKLGPVVFKCVFT